MKGTLSATLLLAALLPSPALADEKIFSATLPGRGELLVEGRFEAAQIQATTPGQPPVIHQGEVAIATAKIIAPSGLLAKAELGRMVRLPRPFSDLRFLATQETPQHTLLANLVGNRAKLLIFDHTSKPATSRFAAFPDDLIFLSSGPAWAAIVWNPETPNQVQATFTSPRLKSSKTFSLLTGQIIEP